jgi:cytochrome P450 family 135
VSKPEMNAEGTISPDRGVRLEDRRGLRPLVFLERMRERYGDVFTVRVAAERQLLVVGDPALVKQVFHAPADVLHAGEGNRPLLGWLFGEHSLGLLDEQRHMTHRRLLLPAFHRQRMERHAEKIQALAGEQLDAWPSGEEVAALPRMRSLTLEAVLDAVLAEGEPARVAALRADLLELQSPQIRNGETEAARRLVERMEALVAEEVVSRREKRVSPSGSEDIFSLLLAARCEDGRPLSNDEVRDEAMTLLTAGYETTATSLTWALERLARNPAALATAEEEAARGAGPYLDAVIYETLRTRPPVTMAARLVKRPFQLGERSLSPGSLIGVSSLLVHHHPDIYPEPMVFRPERFLERQPGTYTWIPFGGGVRRCIGNGFALLEMRTVLSAILTRMTLRPLPPEPEAMITAGSRLIPARGGRVVLDRRDSGGGARARSAARWSDAATWSGDGLRREVFFFDAGGVELYGSLYVAAEPSRPFGVIACQSWGVEADRTDPLVRAVALGMARLGGAGLVFHYPGYGDSFGDLAEADLTVLVDAAVGAAAEGARRCPGLDWILAGFMFGASVACLARQRRVTKRLLLVQPELRPGAYMRRLTKSSEPLAPGPSPRQMMEVGSVPGMTYGYPISRRILDRGDEADAAVAAALAGFDGEGAFVRHLEPEDTQGDGAVPERLERIGVPGVWRFGTQNHPALAEASIEWLDRVT